MTTKLRWFKFYPGDWALDTQGMTPLAKGLYVDMLCMQWAGRRLPADLAELTIMLPAMTERTYRELLQHFVVEDGWLVNGRLERERGPSLGEVRVQTLREEIAALERRFFGPEASAANEPELRAVVERWSRA